MALVKRSEKVTNFVLPVVIKLKNNKSIKKNFYYVDENTLYKAYNQLKMINCNIKPLYPIVYYDIF